MLMVVRPYRYMIEAFYATPIVDIFVQQDYIFVMNRSVAGWKTWLERKLFFRKVFCSLVTHCIVYV